MEVSMMIISTLIFGSRFVAGLLGGLATLALMALVLGPLLALAQLAHCLPPLLGLAVGLLRSN